MDPCLICALQAYLHRVTLRVIREEVYADASEAQEVSEALPPNCWKMRLGRKADFLCWPACTDNLNAGVAVMKSAQDGA